MNKPTTPETGKAFTQGKDSTKQWFDMPKETAEKVLPSSTSSPYQLQKMTLEERANRKKSKPE